MDKELQEIILAVKFHMELERESGMVEFFTDAAGPVQTIAPQGRVSEALDALRSEVAQCVRCDLYKTRLNLVFGSGSPKASLMFVGEAPGAAEDAQGMPFVGRSGQLLTKIIEAMGLKRGDVYIANILKCRPPENRAPLPDEISACWDNLARQIRIIQPKVICTLGKFASQTLLKTETPISDLRGNFHEYDGIKVMPTFHPAYLLRNPGEKKLVWDDMQKIMKEMITSK